MEVEVTKEIRKEIKTSINEFNRLINKEMSFSLDLRKQDKIVLYTNKVIELENALTNGIL